MPTKASRSISSAHSMLIQYMHLWQGKRKNWEKNRGRENSCCVCVLVDRVTTIADLQPLLLLLVSKALFCVSQLRERRKHADRSEIMQPLTYKLENTSQVMEAGWIKKGSSTELHFTVFAFIVFFSVNHCTGKRQIKSNWQNQIEIAESKTTASDTENNRTRMSPFSQRGIKWLHEKWQNSGHAA